MTDSDEFFSRHRVRLLSYLDGDAPAASADPEPLQYVDEVLNEWLDFSRDRKLAEPSGEERTFWFTLYQFEQVAEIPDPNNLHPYEEMMKDQLARVRELLRDGSALPHGLFATRPGEDFPPL